MKKNNQIVRTSTMATSGITADEKAKMDVVAKKWIVGAGLNA